MDKSDSYERNKQSEKIKSKNGGYLKGMAAPSSERGRRSRSALFFNGYVSPRFCM